MKTSVTTAITIAAHAAHAIQVLDAICVTPCQLSWIHPMESTQRLYHRARHRAALTEPSRRASTAHQHAPLVEIGGAVHVVGALDLFQRSARLDRIPVARKNR